jgi:predicted RNase H-like HicB family nuclease
LTSDEAIFNLKEATQLYMEDEPKENLLSRFKNKQYSLTMLNI